MLVMTRKLFQSVQLGDDIEVVVLEIRDDQVRFGIKLPKNVAIHRKEIYDQVLEERRNAPLPD